jgi:hypothetical protein
VITRDYGTRRGLAELTTRKLSVSKEKAWELTALACKLGRSQGAYVGPAGTTLVFFTFGEVTLEKTR